MRLEPNIILIALPLIVPFSSHRSFSPFVLKVDGELWGFVLLFPCLTRLWARSLFLPCLVFIFGFFLVSYFFSLLLWLCPSGFWVTLIALPMQTPKGHSYLLSLTHKEQVGRALT